MGDQVKSSATNRRDFLGTAIKLGCLACLNPGNICPAAIGGTSNDKHKFQDDSKFSFEQVFGFAYKEQLVPNLKAIADQAGNDKVIEILKKATEKRSFEWGKYTASQTPKPDLHSLISWFRNPDWFWQHVLTYSLIEDTPKVIEFKFTECMWAKTFREANAADLGYAIICHGDASYASGYSPKVHFTRTKTLMQGDDHCNHRYEWKE